jgi:hypothetical protein
MGVAMTTRRFHLRFAAVVVSLLLLNQISDRITI